MRGSFLFEEILDDDDRIRWWRIPIGQKAKKAKRWWGRRRLAGHPWRHISEVDICQRESTRPILDWQNDNDDHVFIITHLRKILVIRFWFAEQNIVFSPSSNYSDDIDDLMCVAVVGKTRQGITVPKADRKWPFLAWTCARIAPSPAGDSSLSLFI